MISARPRSGLSVLAVLQLGRLAAGEGLKPPNSCWPLPASVVVANRAMLELLARRLLHLYLRGPAAYSFKHYLHVATAMMYCDILVY